VFKHKELLELESEYIREKAIETLSKIEIQVLKLIVGRRNIPSYNDCFQYYNALTDKELKQMVSNSLIISARRRALPNYVDSTL
jgi:hypothetical protein